MASPLISRLFQLRASRRHALVHEGCVRSFTDLLDRSVTIAARLREEAGVTQGHRVALLASPSPLWVEAFLAIILAGGIAVPLSPSYPAVELAWFANDADACAVLYSADQADRAAPMLEGRAAFRLEDLDRAAAVPTASTLPMLDADDTALLLYTSGTTG